MSGRLTALLALTGFGACAIGGCAMNYGGNAAATGEPLSATWGPVFRQGASPIDEQDFYRIADDPESAAQIARERGRGITYNRLGLVLATIGAGALIAGSQIGSRAYGASVLLPIGSIMAYYGKAKAEQRPHISLHHASEIADRYNSHLGEHVGAAP